MLLRLTLVASALGILVMPATARAEQDATKLAEAGKALAEAGDYTGALVKFRQALALGDTPTLRCNVGAAYYKLSDWMRAHAFLTDCLSVDQEPSYAANLVAARDFCASRLNLEGNHALVDVSTAPDATMSLSQFANDFAVPRKIWLPLGKQVVTIKRERYKTIERELVVSKGAKLAVDLEESLVEPKPPKDDKKSPVVGPTKPGTGGDDRTVQPSRAPAIAAFSAGGVALAGAMVFHVRAVGARDDLTMLPAGTERQDRIDDLKRDRTVMFALYGTAAVATGVGVALLLRSRKTKRVSVTLTPSSVGLWARF